MMREAAFDYRLPLGHDDGGAEMSIEPDVRSLSTPNGAPLEVIVEADTVMVSDAKILRDELPYSVGIVHVAATVPIPPAG
jgi:hypothetical protein